MTSDLKTTANDQCSVEAFVKTSESANWMTQWYMGSVMNLPMPPPSPAAFVHILINAHWMIWDSDLIPNSIILLKHPTCGSNDLFLKRQLFNLRF